MKPKHQRYCESCGNTGFCQSCEGRGCMSCNYTGLCPECRDIRPEPLPDAPQADWIRILNQAGGKNGH